MYAGRPRSPEELDLFLTQIVDRLGRRLRDRDRVCRTVVLRLRYGDFTKATRSRTFRFATDRTALLNDPLPERTWIYQLDRAAGTVRYEAANLSLELPVAPMLGTVGVAPAGREVRSSLVPDMFGGNMDTPEMKAGTTAIQKTAVKLFASTAMKTIAANGPTTAPTVSSDCRRP